MDRIHETRKNRENMSINNRVITLTDVKKTLINDTRIQGTGATHVFSEGSKLSYFLDHKFSNNLFEKYAYYLHYLIMFRSVGSVNRFLNDHYLKFGQYATELFINYPLVSTIDKNVITPMMCASLWSNDPVMIRTLYYWGADISLADVHGKYPNEKYGSFYVNHLNPFIAPNFFVIGIRSLFDFVDVVHEINYIAKEETPPYGWEPPKKAYTSLANSINT